MFPCDLIVMDDRDDSPTDMSGGTAVPRADHAHTCQGPVVTVKSSIPTFSGAAAHGFVVYAEMDVSGYGQAE